MTSVQLLVIAAMLIAGGLFMVMVSYDDIFWALGLVLIVAGIALEVGAAFQHTHETAAVHQHMRDQIRREGWHGHFHDDQIDIGCATFSIKKLGDQYRVVVARPDEQGGGYKPLKPSIQNKIREACPNG